MELKKYIKLSEYAKNNSICYKTAHRYWKNGFLMGKQLKTGTILIEVDIQKDINYI